MKWFGCALLLLLASASSLAAGDPEGEAAARELIELSGAKAQYQQMLIIMTQSIQTGFSTGLAKALKEKPLDPAQRKQAKDILDRHFSRFIGEFQSYLKQTMPWEKLVEEIYLPTYLKHFSAQELREVIAFYRSPTGRKFAEKGPSLSRDAAQAINTKYGKDLQRRAARLTQETLRQIGIELDKLASPNKG
jgi:uncharacterized protein